MLTCIGFKIIAKDTLRKSIIVLMLQLIGEAYLCPVEACLPIAENEVFNQNTGLIMTIYIPYFGNLFLGKTKAGTLCSIPALI